MNDLIPPFDPTGYAAISGSDLYQLVSGLVPSATKGMVVITADVSGYPTVPDAIADTSLQKYIWIRTQASTASAYIWNANGVLNTAGVGFQKWIPVANSVADLSITGTMIAAGTITDDKIYSVDYSKLTSYPLSLPPNGSASGTNTSTGLQSCLTGTYPYPQLANGVVNSSNIVSTGLNPATILTGDGTAEDMLGSSVSDPTKIGFFKTASIVKSASPVKSSSGNTNKFPYCTAGVGTDNGSWGMITVDDTLALATVDGAKLLLNTYGTEQYRSIAHGIAYQAMDYLEAWSSQSQSLAVIGTISSSVTYSATTTAFNNFPMLIRAVLVCVTANSPFLAGVEVELQSFQFLNSSTDKGRPSVCANSDKTVTVTFPDNTITIKVQPPGGTNGYATIDPQKWAVKVYVRGY